MQLINHQQAQEFLHMRRGDLTETEMQALQAHLASCAECSQYAASLEGMERELRNAFHSRWDGIQPRKSQTGGTFIHLGREIMRIRISTFAGTVVGVLALIALILGLDLVLSNLRVQPVAEPTVSPVITTTQTLPTAPSPTESSAAPTQTIEPTPTSPPSSRTLTICQGAEPDTLFLYGASMLAAQNILEAIYDGPIDKVGFSYQPVILEKLPSLADGDATIQPVAVKENDEVVNDSGEVVRLKPGEVVRPYECYQSDCAITWQGEALEMAQMTARFTLIDGILWSDGEPLTANDSVFSFETASGCKSPWDTSQSCGSLGEGRAVTMDRTSSYTALDDRTTEWVGIPGFLDQSYMTNFAHPLAEHQLRGLNADELYDAEASARKPLGWGAYMIDRWKPGEQISFTRNPNYFRADEGLPYFDKLVIRFYGADEAATEAALQNGECDLIDREQAEKNVQLASLVRLDEDGLIQSLVTTGTTWEHLDFNIRPAESILNSGTFAGWDLDGDGQGPFGDVRLRKAIAMCLDRNKIVEGLFMGRSMVLNTYLPPNHPLINTQAMVYSFHPVTAGTLLDETGWLDQDNDPSTPRTAMGVLGVPDGTPLVMNYETTTAEIRQQVFDILSQNLAECGIQVNLVTYSANDYFKSEPGGRVYGRLYDLAEFAWLTGVNPPCSLFLGNDVPSEANNWSGQNTVGYINPTYDAACSLQLQSLPGGEGYLEGVMEAQRIFSEELPVVPIFMQVKYAAARVDMCGYNVDPTSPSDFWNIEAYNYGEGCR